MQAEAQTKEKENKKIRKRCIKTYRLKDREKRRKIKGERERQSERENEKDKKIEKLKLLDIKVLL